jgi:beta-galactosidase
MKRELGTCYYPEHWPEEIWANDAKRMAAAGLTWVRIGEFSWNKIEPAPENYDWQWLDNAIQILGEAGLKVVLGTPTATPPRWMLDRHPDMLAVDAEGRPRKFGSRRHYCFSHEGYRRECARIVTALAERYGKNNYVAAWQTDNEYGCHDTAISYSNTALMAFRQWLRMTYPGDQGINGGDIKQLNTAWGNVFWSMEYSDFDQIDLPNLTVTEPNPSHLLAFRRFSSHQVVTFNRLQCIIIRQYSNAPITHNFMGRITEFDHFHLGEDLDIASWDSYPLGFLEDRVNADNAHKRHFSRQGDPHFQAFHHDLYRAVGKGRWWVMEQQPGPVNWAHYNPAPMPGMVRLWTWEAFAHGAEVISYFRWRQVPFAQEQLHSGLLRPDGVDAPGLAEICQVAGEIKAAPDVTSANAPIAILFDYDAASAWSIQPHGHKLDYFDLIFDTYRAMRSLGLSIDILPASTRDFTDYEVIAAPGMMHMPSDLKNALRQSGKHVLLGPRSAARNGDMAIPIPLPPDFPDLDLTVSFVESLRPDITVKLENGGCFIHYREEICGSASIVERTADGQPAIMEQNGISYLGGWPDPVAMKRIIKRICDNADVATRDLPDGVGVRATQTEEFWFNYNTTPQKIGELILQPISVSRHLLPGV